MITNAKYTDADNKGVTANFDGVAMNVPCEVGNRHWDAILSEGITPDAYVAPVATIQQQIDELEAQQTPRLMREAIKGETFAVNKINELDTQIEALRAQL